MAYLLLDHHISSYCIVVVTILACSLLYLPHSCAEDNLLYKPDCSGNGTNRVNINNMLYNMKSESSKTGFYEDTQGTGSDQVSGSYLCQGDIPLANCSKCVQSAIDDIMRSCPNQIQAKIRYDKCILQYSNESFSGVLVDDYITWCGYGQYIQSPEFDKVLSDTLTKAARKAAADETPGRKYGTMEANLTFVEGLPILYTLAQCVPNISPDLCLQCLNRSITTDFPQWCQHRYSNGTTQNGRTISSSCIIRYDINRFYTVPASAPAPAPASALPQAPPPLVALVMYPPKGNGLPRILVAVGISTSAVMLLALGMWCYVHNGRDIDDFEGIDMEEITNAESLQMDFSKVRAATLNFAPDRKLGEGGFGDVYKGKLENGQEIAVKRLTTSNSGQGTAEFKNEVVLVAKLQHRNLVKLLGFCLTAKEKILVYEYLPNSSLDKVLFDPIKRASLDWEKRFNIIYGIAKGLLYLLEDSRLRIIHRDLKSSNILLDEAMNPKISDFGIAKTLALDQTRASTEILAGTYGYMAPEYVLTGQYSLKSDIYSFGIIVLEIVTGQRNRFYGRPLLEEALLHRAWRLWNENTELEMADSELNDAYSVEEVVKCIHIGLLCIQEDAGKRPKMASVVAALSGKSVDLPPPTPPNFFNISRSIDITSGSTSATTSTTTTSGTQSSLLPNPVN